MNLTLRRNSDTVGMKVNQPYLNNFMKCYHHTSVLEANRLIRSETAKTLLWHLKQKFWIVKEENKGIHSNPASSHCCRDQQNILWNQSKRQEGKGRCHKLTKTNNRSWPFNSQDLISNSPYSLLYSFCDVSLENLVLDQLMIP